MQKAKRTLILFQCNYIISLNCSVNHLSAQCMAEWWVGTKSQLLALWKAAELTVSEGSRSVTVCSLGWLLRWIVQTAAQQELPSQQSITDLQSCTRVHFTVSAWDCLWSAFTYDLSPSVCVCVSECVTSVHPYVSAKSHFPVSMQRG